MINRKLEALRQLQTIGRASLRTEIAKHAARRIEGEGRQHLLLVHLVAFAYLTSNRANLYAINWTRERAQIARDAQRRTVLRIEVQTRRAAEPLRHACRLK